MGSQEQQAAEVLKSLDAKQLQEVVIKALVAVAEKDEELTAQRRLISDLSQRDQKNRKRAQQIIDEAKEQAEFIRQEAESILTAAKEKAEEADKQIEEMLDNAAQEANSIVFTQINDKKHEIAVLESKRDKTKRLAVNLCSSIADSIDSAIENIENHISDYKAQRDEIDELVNSIKTETFTNFDINDFVDESTVAQAQEEEPAEEVSAPTPTVDEDIQLSDTEAAALSYLNVFLNEPAAEEETTIPDILISATEEVEEEPLPEIIEDEVAEEVIETEIDEVVVPEIAPEPEPVAVTPVIAPIVPVVEPEPVVAPTVVEPEPTVVSEPEPEIVSEPEPVVVEETVEEVEGEVETPVISVPEIFAPVAEPDPEPEPAVEVAPEPEHEPVVEPVVETVVENVFEEIESDDNELTDEDLAMLEDTFDFGSDDSFDEGEMKSFTSSFMAVNPNVVAEDEEENDIDDFADFGEDDFEDADDLDDFMDSIDDFDFDLDDEEEEEESEPEPEPEPEPAPAPIKVPTRSHGRSTGTPSRWLN